MEPREYVQDVISRRVGENVYSESILREVSRGCNYPVVFDVGAIFTYAKINRLSVDSEGLKMKLKGTKAKWIPQSNLEIVLRKLGIKSVTVEEIERDAGRLGLIP